MFPLGAWEYHWGLSLIANTDAKPLRVIVNANETDNRYQDAESTHHNWVLANQRMGSALKAKGYHYQMKSQTAARPAAGTPSIESLSTSKREG